MSSLRLSEGLEPRPDFDVGPTADIGGSAAFDGWRSRRREGRGVAGGVAGDAVAVAAPPLFFVVPAHAGTHNPWRQRLQNLRCNAVFESKVLGVWVPAFAGTTANCISSLFRHLRHGAHRRDIAVRSQSADHGGGGR